MRQCDIDECDRGHYARGMCSMHYQRRWRKENPEKHKALWMSFYERNVESCRERARKYYYENREICIERVTIYRRERYRNDPDFRSKENARRRKYRKHLSDLMEDYAGMCGICGEDMFGLESDSDIHVDHIVPVSRGGTDDYDNLQPAHAVCNIKKGAS